MLPRPSVSSHFLKKVSKIPTNSRFLSQIGPLKLSFSLWSSLLRSFSTVNEHLIFSSPHVVCSWHTSCFKAKQEFLLTLRLFLHSGEWMGNNQRSFSHFFTEEIRQFTVESVDNQINDDASISGLVLCMLSLSHCRSSHIINVISNTSAFLKSKCLLWKRAYCDVGILYFSFFSQSPPPDWSSDYPPAAHQ